MTIEPQPSWPALMAFGLLTRVVVVAWGMHCAEAPRPPDLIREESLVAPGNVGYGTRHLLALATPGRKPIEPWYRWDAMWYAEISVRGYSYSPTMQSSAPFLPLLPLLMAAGVRLGLDRYWVGLVVPNLAFALGLASFGRVVHRVTGEPGTTWRACLLTAAYPYSFFFSAPYQESLGLALCALALLAWLDRRPIAAGVCLLWATLARLTAMAMSGALIAQWCDDRLHGRPARHSAWLVALAGVVGFGLFCMYMGLRVGDPLAALHAQAAWQRQPASAGNLFVTLLKLFELARETPLFGFVALGLLFWTCQHPLRAAFARLRTWVLVESPAAHERPRGPRRRSRDRREPEPKPPAAAEAQAPADWPDRLATALALAVVLVGLGLALPDGPVRRVFSGLEGLGSPTALCLFTGLGVHAWWKRGAFWGCLVLLPLVPGMATGTFLSMNRFALASFPAFIDLAELLRPRWLFVVWLVAMTLAQIRLIDLFINWNFVG
jgi:hypothetical protein